MAIRRSFISFAAFAVAGSLTAHAADLGQEIAYTETVATPHFDWAGPYIGVHGGWGMAHVDGVFDVSELEEGNPDGSETTFVDDMDPDGWLGGFHAGYNFQQGSFVLGPEIDISFADINGDAADEEGNDVVEANINWLASLRLRAGVAFDRVLVYGTGGLAYANGDFEVIDDLGDVGDENSGSAGIDAWGGVLGGGLEFAVTNNVALRIEGLHYFFDEESDTSDLTDDSDPGDFVSLDGVTVVRAGLSLGF